MKTKILYLFIMIFAVFMIPSIVNAQCDHTLKMDDSYGDGWNGNTMDVLVNGVVVLDDVGLSYGSTTNLTFSASTGDNITTLWNGGGTWGSETSYKILDAEGNVIGNGAESSITTAVVGACPSCPPPSNLTVTNLIATGAQLNWTTGGATTFAVEYGPKDFIQGTGTYMAVSTDDFLVITGLTPENQYEWYVKDSCAAADVSDWSAVNSFTTTPTCPAPTNQIVTDITTTSVQLNWTTGGATNFALEYGPEGFTQGTGNYIAVANDTFLVVTGLTSGTKYDWYIKDSCGPTDVSTWTGSNSFITVFVPTYYEDFTSFLPDSWTKAVGVLETNTILTGTSSGWGSGNFGNAGTNKGTKVNIWSTTKKEWIISPSIDLSGGANNYLDFDLALTNYNSSGDDDMGADDTLAIVISTDNGITWDKANILKLWTAASNKPSTTGDHFYIDLSSYSTIVKIGIYASSTVSNTDYEMHFDNFKVSTPPSNEVEIVEITRNYGGFDVSTADTVVVIVRNNGALTQAATPINFKLDNETVVSTTMPSIAAFSTATFEFTTNFDASASGPHILIVYTSLTGDENMANDTITKTFITYGTHTIPFTEDFEAGYTYLDNKLSNTTNYNLNTILSHSGNQSVKNAYAASSDDILQEAGAIDLSSTINPVLDFWHIAKLESPNYDKGFIEISTDNGATWIAIDDSLYLGESTNYNNGYFDETSYSLWGGGNITPNNTWWKMERFNLEAFKEDSVRVRFNLHSDSGTEHDGWSIDDITIQEEPTAIAILGNDTTLCAGSDIDLFAGSLGYQYLWTANGDTVSNITSTINTDSAGIYTVEVTGLASIAYDTIVIADVDIPTITSFTSPGEICIGDDVTLSASFTGASPWDFNYSKVGVDTTDIAAATTPWTSSFALADTSEFTIISITDANGCISNTPSNTLTVNVNPLPMAAIASLPNICANGSIFTYTQGSGSAGGSGYYSGTGVDSTSSTFSAVTAGSGSHTITYTYIDSNSCVNSASEIQLVDALPNITAVATDNPVPYNTTTTLTATVSNAVGTISYAWTPSINITETDTTTSSLTTTNSLSLVNYYVTVLDDGNSCSTMDTIVLPYSGGPVSVSPSSNPTSICSGDTAILSSGTSGGSGTVNYVWTSMPVGFTSTDENPSVSPTVDTWYIIAATDDVLTTTDSVLVTILSDPTISYAVDTTYACLGSDASAIVNITGTAPFSYTYNGIITNATDNIDTIMITAGVDATYQLTSVTDDNGCNSTGDFDSLVISAWALPTTSASDNDTMCYGDSVLVSLDFTGIAPWNFDVNDGSMVNNVSSTVNPFTAYTGPDVTTMYTVVSITDGNGCISTGNLDSITVLVNQLPTATVSDYDTLCIGDSVQLAINFNGAAPYTFNVNIEANPLSLVSSSDAFTIYVNPAVTTNFILTSITDGNGCITDNLTDTAEVFVNPIPTAPTFTGLAADYCEDAAVVSLSGLPTGGTFNGNGITGNDFDPSNANSGSNDIEYRIADANGCENFVINTSIINTLPSISITGLANDYCVDAPTATLAATPTGTGGVWTGNVTTTGDFSPATQGVGTHTAFYTFTDANSCVNTDSVSTMVNDLPVITVTTLADVCADANNFMITGASPVGGNWSGNGVSSNYFNATNAGAGSHYLVYTYTDANSCVNLDSTIQLVNALPIITINGLDAAYCADADSDTLSATPTGGSFFGVGMTANIFDPSMVNHGYVNIIYMYTDAVTGCFNSTPAATMVNAIPVVDLGSDNTVCEYNTSMLDAANAGATFLWSTSATTQTIVLDTNGFGIGDFMYNVLVTDANMCSTMDSVEITYEATPISQLTDTNTICGEDAYITLDAGYVSGNSYVWSNGISYSSITINSNDLGGNTGNMSVVITSNAGCVYNDTTYVYFREVPVVDLGGDQIVCINHEFTLDAGAGFTSYLWNTGATTQSITIDSNTFDVGQNTLKVEVYNDVNCNAMDSLILVVDPCTGVQTPELTNANINIYPNPTKGQFQIDVVGLENEEYNLDIYNSVGAVVYSDKVSNDGNNKQTWKLDFSSYAKGVYYVRLHSNGDIKVKRIVIN